MEGGGAERTCGMCTVCIDIFFYTHAPFGVKKKDCLIYIAKPKFGSFIYNRVVCPLYSVIFPERVSVLDGGKVFRFLLVVIYSYERGIGNALRALYTTPMQGTIIVQLRGNKNETMSV